jgi:hypothetical protein
MTNELRFLSAKLYFTSNSSLDSTCELVASEQALCSRRLIRVLKYSNERSPVFQTIDKDCNCYEGRMQRLSLLCPSYESPTVLEAWSKV